MSARPAGKKPVKPLGCPLFPHSGGTWAKTVNGRHKHFGPWHDLGGALRRYDAFANAYVAGQQPRAVPDGALVLSHLANKYVTHHHARARAKEITLRSFRDIKKAVEDFIESVGSHSRVSSLAPENFAAYRNGLIARMGHHAVKRNVTLVRGMFKWAYENDVMEHPMKFGSGFASYKKERAQERKRKRDQSYTGGEVHRMVAAAGVPLKAMILMAVNCGFGNTDVATLRWDSIDLADGWLDTFRQKTGNARRSPLWRETVKALRAVKALGRKARDAEDKGKVFLNANGVPYVRETPEVVNGNIVGATVVDNIPQEFGRLMGRIGLYKTPEHKPGKPRRKPLSDGRGFYDLRRTHRTWAGDVKDMHAADLIMGHAFETMGGTYVQNVPDERLRAVTDHIRSKVFT